MVPGFRNCSRDSWDRSPDLGIVSGSTEGVLNIFKTILKTLGPVPRLELEQVTIIINFLHGFHGLHSREFPVASQERKFPLLITNSTKLGYFIHKNFPVFQLDDVIQLKSKIEPSKSGESTSVAVVYKVNECVSLILHQCSTDHVYSNRLQRCIPHKKTRCPD